MESEQGSLSERERQLEEVIAGYYLAVEAGCPPARDEFLARHPDLRDVLAAFLDDKAAFERRAGRPRLPKSDEPTDSFLPASDDATATCDDRVAGDPVAVVQYFGNYELIEEIARGGMGVVFKARQVNLTVSSR